MTIDFKAPVDLSILERVSESDVTQWLAAKLSQVRESGFPIHVLSIAANFKTYSPKHECPVYASWTMHAGGECVMDHRDTADALTELRQKVSGNPKAQAAKRRQEAQRLLDEARDLDLIKT